MLSTHFVCCDDSSLARSKEALHCCYQVTSIICHLVYLAGPCSRLMLPRGALRPRINILDYMIAVLPSRILQVVFYVQTCRTHPLPPSMRSAQTHQRSITLSLPRQNLLLTAHAKQGFLRASAGGCNVCKSAQLPDPAPGLQLATALTCFLCRLSSVVLCPSEVCST